MDLDTNVKKFRYSMLKKVLCIMLSLVTMLSSVTIVLKLVYSYNYFGSSSECEQSTDFTDCDFFRQYLMSDVYDNIMYVTGQYRNEKERNFLEKQTNEVVEKFYIKFIKEFKRYSADDYLENDSVYLEVPVNENNTSFLTFSLPLYEILENVCADYYLGDNSYLYDYYDGEVFWNSVTIIRYVDNNANSVREYIKNEYKNEIINKYGDNEYSYYHNNSESLKIYAQCDKYSTAKRNGFNEKKENIKNYDYYFIFENGKAASKGLSDKVVDALTSACKDYENTNLFLYFDFSGEKSNNIIARYDSFDLYRELQRDYATAKKTIENSNKNLAAAIILAVLSIAFALAYFVVAGRKNDTDKAKLAFIDYVPLELHLAINALIGVGVVCLLSLFSNIMNLNITMLYVNVVIAVIAIAVPLVGELVASVIRCFSSDRRLYKFFLVCWLAIGLYKLGRIIFKLFRRLNDNARKRNRKFIETVFCKPENFKRNVMLLLICYALINILLMFLEILFCSAEILFLVGFVAILFTAMNAVAIYFAVKYMSQLDRIIKAARAHTELDEDLNTLYCSLGYLAESMKYTNAELQAAVAKAVKDERLRSELITNVSHDLKTPLTSIITYVDLLSKCDIQDEKAKEYIAVLDDKGAKLKRLIDDLIEASKVTSGNVTVNLTSINLSELSLQSTVDAQSDFEKAGLTLIVKDCQKAPVVNADGAKTFRIIENLLSNARKYSARASRVYVDVYSENGYGIFEIKNISAQPLDITPEELTERFVRGDKSRNQEGNGLGLSIAKELCRLQNGELELIIDGDLFKARVKLPLIR